MFARIKTALDIKIETKQTNICLNAEIIIIIEWNMF